jgi:hypothetical protein
MVAVVRQRDHASVLGTNSPQEMERVRGHAPVEGGQDFGKCLREEARPAKRDELAMLDEEECEPNPDLHSIVILGAARRSSRAELEV